MYLFYLCHKLLFHFWHDFDLLEVQKFGPVFLVPKQKSFFGVSMFWSITRYSHFGLGVKACGWYESFLIRAFEVISELLNVICGSRHDGFDSALFNFWLYFGIQRHVVCLDFHSNALLNTKLFLLSQKHQHISVSFSVLWKVTVWYLLDISDVNFSLNCLFTFFVRTF